MASVGKIKAKRESENKGWLSAGHTEKKTMES